MKGSCHCGAVSLEVPARPDYLNLCNCTLCTKLSGMWAYYPRAEVTITGATQTYRRTDIDHVGLDTHFCGRCSATTHWSAIDPDYPRMGVNMRLFDPAELQGVEVRYGDRRNDYEGERRYYREPTVFDGVSA